MELKFRGIEVEEKEYIPLLPSWAYSKEEIKNLLKQYVKDQKKFVLKGKENGKSTWKNKRV